MVNSRIELVKSIAPHREKMVTVIMSCNFDGEGRRGGMGKKVIYVEEKRVLVHVCISSRIVYTVHNDLDPLQSKEMRIIYHRQGNVRIYTGSKRVHIIKDKVLTWINCQLKYYQLLSNRREQSNVVLIFQCKIELGQGREDCQII